jgi:hypothetical protein
MDAHRDTCKRQHRVLGHFLAIQAWLRGLDCIVVSRLDLEVFLGLERFKKQRVEWLQEDLRPWFQSQFVVEQGGAGFSLHSLYLSRVPIEKWLADGELSTEERIAKLGKGAPKTEEFAKVPRADRSVTELDVVRYLAILDSGLAEPVALRSIPKNAL